MSPDDILRRDLDEIVENFGEGWKALDGARIFVTGGTGFIGRWLLESLRHAKLRLGFKIEATILTRDYAKFDSKVRHLAEFDGFSFLSGNVIDFAADIGPFSHIVHAATDASAQLNAENPLLMFDTIVEGTRKVLELAAHNRGARVLNLSSGAVYGRQPPEIARIDENWLGAPDCRLPVNAYGEGKRAAEMLCAIYARQFGVDVVTARIFALLGPFLPLGSHFAIGNFILDAINRRPIIVQSDGRAVRSYLYATDLMVWLFWLLTGSGKDTVYNIGSERDISIGDLAKLVANLIGAGEFRILGSPDAGWNSGRYVPSTAALEQDLDVRQSVSLEEALLRTAQWHGWKRQTP